MRLAGRLSHLWVVVAAFLWVVAVGLVMLGSADAPIDVRNSAYWYRTLRSVPGLTDVCGDFTWLARSIPPGLAAVGGALPLMAAPRSRLSWSLAGVGFVLAVFLANLTLRNAVPWGELGCIVD